MKTTDLFKINRTSKRLNESMFKTFGRKLNLETFNIEQLEDARNKLRTQIYTARSSSSFNENVENDALSQAQFMHDAIVAELSERDEPIVDNTVREGNSPEVEEFLTKVAQSGDDGFDMLYDAQAGKYGKEIEQAVQEMYDDITIDTGYHGDDDFEQIYDRMLDNIEADYGDRGSNDEGLEIESAPPTAKGERMVKHIKQGYAKDGKLTDVEKSKAYGAAWKAHNNEDMNTNEAYINNAEDAINLLAAIRKQSKMAERGAGDPVRPNQLVNDLWDVMQWIEANMKESIETESVNTGDNMTRLREGEIQQASAIVTAKTMVDRVGRWIEELSGMENDTLLQLGDSIRDEMGQEQAKQFISTVAPAIQSALENLKQARETLSGGVRTLTGEEQPAEMLGGEPGADIAAPAEPDAMNPAADDMASEPAGDDFDAAEPAAGGLGDAGREQRESIDRQGRLLKVLAG
jgi:hypothetical protein